ncbi:MAG: Crp/Fnr family transcriptional regulator [Chloroflexi bacterium]|nr:Crp/Fnr family transcriptional regulator [Chloroflexota bacterium]
MNLNEFIAQHPYFAELDETERQDLATTATVRTLARGEILALEGDECHRVYIVAQGRIQALKMSAEGREQVVAELLPGQVFYAVPALDGQGVPTTTQAATRATVIGFECQQFVHLLATHPTVAMHLLRDFAARLRRLSQLVEDLALRPVSARLARLLVERALSPQGHRMTQREMASRLGTVREVVSRALSEFEGRGWIAVHRGRIDILDLEALKRETMI